MRVRKDKVRLTKIRGEEDIPFVPGSPQERLRLIWELTVELWSLKGEDLAKRRLQRHITNLIKKRG